MAAGMSDAKAKAQAKMAAMRGGEETDREEKSQRSPLSGFSDTKLFEVVTSIRISSQILLETGSLSDGSGKVKFFFEINKSDGKRGLNNARNHLEQGEKDAVP